LKPHELAQFALPPGEVEEAAARAFAFALAEGLDKKAARRRLRDAIRKPHRYLRDPGFGALAALLKASRDAFQPRETPAPFRQWGEDLEENSIQQMRNACALPVSVRGALMPDAHLGYGLPIGGVLATQGAVIPYAVGVDIACRVKMTVLDLPLETLDDDVPNLTRSIDTETRFGIGAHFKRPRQHDVLDEDWSVTPVTADLKSKAWKQLGTSGSGNHFVEFGKLEVTDPGVGVAPGSYLALLSHSGSRGAGATVADHYSRLAMQLHPELPYDLRHLSWLDLDTAAGQEYWQAMELMGKYAAANHACIHRHVTGALGAEVLLDLENHHNFAWKEEHDGETVIVHRKGATPAGEGVLGIIPGSMATSTYVVRGKGDADSLHSSSHGAGRVMSRKKAKETLSWSVARKMLDERGVTLLSAGLDEVPMVYKNIDSVMAAQADLVEPLARFEPRLVKMAPAGEPPED